MDVFLGKIDSDDNSKSDFWLIEDEYVKEIRYIGKNPKVYIYELDDFINNNPNHPMVDKIKSLKNN